MISVISSLVKGTASSFSLIKCNKKGMRMTRMTAIRLISPHFFLFLIKILIGFLSFSEVVSDTWSSNISISFMSWIGWTEVINSVESESFVRESFKTVLSTTFTPSINGFISFRSEFSFSTDLSDFVSSFVFETCSNWTTRFFASSIWLPW